LFVIRTSLSPGKRTPRDFKGSRGKVLLEVAQYSRVAAKCSGLRRVKDT